MVGFYTVTQLAGDEMAAIVNYESVDEARLSEKGTISMIMARIANPNMADSISDKVDDSLEAELLGCLVK